MSSERQQKIEAIFRAAARLADAEREQYLTEAGAGDETMAGEVKKLLSRYDAENSTADQELDSMEGRLIGAYRLIREIGRGGMGAVYLATRADGMFRTEAAVKLIKRGMDSDSILRRFRNERQILATLNHPNIARLLDGGTTPEGLPYFVMEFVKGKPLFEFCNEQNLDLRERLKIFREICDAVCEVHRIKVVHRDLKPSNILVKADGTPKLLDFGIAKLLDPELAAATLELTLTQWGMMTPQYASPEQIYGGEITSASDIYSLGVLLYELITGVKPYRFTSSAPHEISRVICETEPLPPSRVESLGLRVESLRFRPPTSNSQLSTLNSQLSTPDSISADLDKIVLKALRKSPSERYQTAEEFGADIDRYLENRPVAAEFFTAQTNFEIPKNQPPDSRSIAILPFKLLSAGQTGDSAEDEYLTLGLADALVTRLSGVKRLLVRPTSSVIRFSENTDAFAAGHKLGVEYVVEGNIRRVGDRIRVTTQLLDIKGNSTCWAKKFDERLTDVLEFEDLISERVAKSLLPQLSGEEEKLLQKRGTNSPEAYEAYLRGRYYTNQFKEDSLLKSVEAYREAIRLDPQYALPHVGIADFYVLSAIFGAIPTREGYPKAKAELGLALEADPSLAEAYALSAFIALLYDWDWPQAERLAGRALELNPNYYLAHDVNAHILASKGVSDRAVQEIKHSEELDPLSPRAKLMTSCIFYQTRHFDEGAAKAEEASEMQTNFPQAFLHLGNSLTHNGNASKAVEVLSESSRIWENSVLPKYMLCFALAADNRRNEARKILDEILSAARTQYVKPYFVAMAATALGEIELAFEWFDRTVEARDDWMLWFGTDIKLDGLRKDARYFEILRKTNNPIIDLQPERPQREATTGNREKAVAVLPFKLLSAGNSAESEDDYLSVALADALILRLSNVRRFVVRPTSSILRFQETGSNPFEAGHELGVEYVVEGTIRRVAQRIRVSIQLLEIKGRATRWAQSFDENFRDVLELEDSISEKVARQLIPQLSGEEQKKISKRGTNNAEAHQAYLRGRYFWSQFLPETFPKALEFFEKAVALDPNYALAYVGIADFYNWATIFGFFPPREGYEKTRTAVLRALEIDDQSSEAFAVLGFLTAFSDFKWEEAERLLKRSIELNPNNGLAHEWYAALLAGTGRHRESKREILRSNELDPLSVRAITLTAWTLYQLRLYPEALAKAEEIIDMNPTYYQGFLQRGNILSEMGRAAEAVADLEKVIQLAPEIAYTHYHLCHALTKLGRLEEAREVTRNLEQTAARRIVNSYHLAMCYAALDEREAAFEGFDKAIEMHDLWLVWLATEPKLDGLRADPRFDELLKRVNFKPPARESKPAPDEKKSIAVLPFKTIGAASDDDEYLGIGLADALTTRFSNIQNFIVRPTSSVLPFAKAEIDPLAAGKNLAVEYIVEGNIRRAGDRIRVTAQLLNVNQAATDWSQPFDEKYTDILALEDSISEKVAISLLPQLSGEEAKNLSRRGTDHRQAYESFLKGRFYWNSMTEEGFAKAIRFYEQAAALDARYALAHASIAEAYIHFGIQCMRPFAECSRRAKEAAEKAVALDPTLAEAHAALGFAVMNGDFDWQTGISNFRRAARINPNSMMAHFWLQTYYLQTRRFEEALTEAKKVVEIEPNSLFAWHILAWAYFNNRKFDETVSVHRQIIESNEDYAFANLTLSWVLRLTGKFDEAIEQARKGIQLEPGNPMYLTGLAAACAAAGQIEECEKTLEEIARVSAEKYVSPYMLAIVQVCLGDFEKAFEFLREAARIRDTWILWVGVDPQFEPLRDDPRYQEILRSINHPLVN